MRPEELVVVAVQALLPGGEVMARDAIVESPDGHRFTLTAQDGPDVTPRAFIQPAEFAQNLETGVFLPLPRWPAKAGYVIGLVSTGVLDLIAELNIQPPRVESTPLASGWGFGWYLPRETFLSLRERVATRLAESLRDQLARAHTDTPDALLGVASRIRMASQIALNGSETQLAIALMRVLYAEAMQLDVGVARRAALAGLPRVPTDFDACLAKLRQELEGAAREQPERRHQARRQIAQRLSISRAHL